jgi:RNA polymerase sigma-70 factor (ECF subfamily)
MEIQAQEPSGITKRSPARLPSREQELLLHQRLVERDVLAPSDLAAAYLDHLITWLVSRYPKIREELCQEAAEEAILALIRNPQSYNPERQTLPVYLHISARGDLLNLCQKGKALAEKQESWETVEQSPQAGKYLGCHDDPSLPLQIAEELVIANEQLASVRKGLSEGESAVLDLVLSGERGTAEYVKALKITHLPKGEQDKEVKRAKAKVNKRLERTRARNDQAS